MSGRPDRSTSAPGTPRARTLQVASFSYPAADVDARRRTGRRVAFVLGLVAVFAIGATVRLWGIDRFGFNSDEAVYAGQGAAISDVDGLSERFPIFRAHPLLFQFLIAIAYRAGVSDLTPRLMSVAFGIGTILLTFALARLLYERRTAFLAALFLAVMPYHVVVTRQALLDGPMTFFATLTFYLVARYAVGRRPVALYGAAAAMGLTVLTKETGILYLSAAYAFFSLTPEIRIPARRALLALAIVFLVVLPFPLSLVLGGGSETGRSYLVWQLFREPNHAWTFYLTEVPRAVGPLLLLAAALYLWQRGLRRWQEMLLLSWIVAPLLFFQLWPVKGYQYLLPVAVPVAILGARLLSETIGAVAPRRVQRVLARGAVVLVAGTLLASTLAHVGQTSGGELLAGTGGVPGGREAGRWIAANTPEGATFITVGPSMANLIKFYGDRDAFGLSVSPNPLHRNPSYEPVVNPDQLFRDSQVQYVMWDAFSASRSPFFSQKLLRYVELYNGRITFTYTVPVPTVSGRTANRAVIVIYEVRPTLRSIEQEQEEE